MTFVTRRTFVAGAAALAAPRFISPAEARSFEAFVAGLWPAASAAGVSRSTFDRAFSGVQPNARVIELSQRQPEFRLRVKARGYEPAESRVFRADEEQVESDFALKPAGNSPPSPTT